MTELSAHEAVFLGTVLEAAFYGVYCIVFTLYLTTQKNASSKRLLYPLVALFVLCTAFMVLDFTQQFIILFRPDGANAVVVTTNLNLTTSTIYSLVDFISQCILIYRCWIMWERSYVVIATPVIMVLASFSTCLAIIIELGTLGLTDEPPVWFFPLGAASFSISAVVNMIVTFLLILKLVRHHRDLAGVSGASSNLLPLIAVLAESGLFTVFAQIIWAVLFGLQHNGFNAVNGLITMVYGITPTIIIVRVTMGTVFGGSRTQLNHGSGGISTMKFGSTNKAGSATYGGGSTGAVSEKSFSGDV